ncbi:hypothetical protein BDP27DRAFT_1376101 [Rhodocollybia butyracea]|uniref:Uncharacterized protein n=1 Tax=Rhodocollybia butyracea TaxID=206335 RepID=A0A9P5P471_9AGAR|nr:hypothetical protein BDP27DRAFT_1376101 [Rhodocollybia butyracea]
MYSKPKVGRKNGGKMSEGIVFHTLGGNIGQASEVRDKKMREKAAEMARIGPGKFPETPTQYEVYCRNEIQVVQQEQNANQKVGVETISEQIMYGNPRDSNMQTRIWKS